VLLATLSNPNAQLLNPVTLDQISPWMVEATVSTEDNSFWTHPGVNLKGLIRAAYENYVLNSFGAGTGGSSITQQLIKNVYICPSVAEDGDNRNACVTAERTLDRKLREIAYAIELEQDYTKEQILTWYLNQISYADRYIGVEAAAQGYFRKPAKDLTLAEAALLAGIPQAPTAYHPRLNCVKDNRGECITDELGRAVVGGELPRRKKCASISAPTPSAPRRLSTTRSNPASSACARPASSPKSPPLPTVNPASTWPAIRWSRPSTGS
jgi:membrane peptidoglycan carboxypeptidase